MTEQTLLNLISRSLWKDEQPTEIPSEVASEAEHQAVAGLILKTSYQQIAYYIRYTYEEQEMIRLLDDLRRESGTTVVMVTHDLALAERCDRMIRIEDGEIVRVVENTAHRAGSIM